MLIGRFDRRLDAKARRRIRAVMTVGDGDECRPNPDVQCPEPYLADGQPFRLVFKPNARAHVLKKHGIDVSDVAVQGGVYVKVPLGQHGTDGIGIDVETSEIGCVLCGKAMVQG